MFVAEGEKNKILGGRKNMFLDKKIDLCLVS
jgi:hypothetical protein